MDPYAKAKTELTEIDSQIAALQRRKAVLRQFVDLGESLYGGSGHHAETASSTPNLDRVAAYAGLAVSQLTLARQNTAKARILDASAAIVSTEGPTPTRTLVERLEAQGIEITGADKINTLSVLLSKSDDFQSDRKAGWSLTRPRKEATPAGGDTPAGV